MRKIYGLMIAVLSILTLSSCGQQKLLILNWGEYINEDIVARFEKAYGVEVSISIADSNELFYAKAKSGTTAYDLIVPSDYMIEKMVQENLLQEIDFTKLSNYDPTHNPYTEGLLQIQSTMSEAALKHHVPYFWGTFGLMYNKRVAGLEEAVKTYSWKAYFDKSLRPVNTRVGMYDVAQYAYATAMLYEGFDPNANPNDIASNGKKYMDIASNAIANAGFSVWADDALKKDIQANNLDLAYVWTGDFLDMLYADLDAGVAYDDMPYDIYIPDDTMAFVDAFVIPTKARHVDLAHEFIDYFLDPENAYENASVVGYATPLQNTYNQIAYYVGDETWETNWASAYRTYYPVNPDFAGKPYATFSSKVLSDIQNMVNRIKA